MANTVGKVDRLVPPKRDAGSVRLAAPEPEILRIIGQESKRKGTHKLTSRQIDRIIKVARNSKKIR